MRDKIERSVKRCITPYIAFFQVFIETKTGNKRTIGFDLNRTVAYLVRNEEFFKNYFC